MSEPQRSATDGDDFATVDVINEARRPLLIARHHTLVIEMEQGLAEAFISGDVDHPRLLQMLADLAAESEVNRISRTLTLLSEDAHYAEQTLQQALTNYLCLLREDSGIEVAALQMHAIGVYRNIRTRLLAHQGQAPTLAELRELSMAAISRLLCPAAPAFGKLGMLPVFTRSYVEQRLRDIKALRQGDQSTITWHDEDMAAGVSREDRQKVRDLPEAERTAAIAFLAADRVRSSFYRAVFIEYLSIDEFDASASDLPPTVLAWLQGMAETPHLFPFLQGHTTEQKAFRLAMLTQKIVQLFEIYARVEQALGDQRMAGDLVGKSTRERLVTLVKHHYPPISV